MQRGLVESDPLNLGKLISYFQLHNYIGNFLGPKFGFIRGATKFYILNFLLYSEKLIIFLYLQVLCNLPPRWSPLHPVQPEFSLRSPPDQIVSPLKYSRPPLIGELGSSNF